MKTFFYLIEVDLTSRATRCTLDLVNRSKNTVMMGLEALALYGIVATLLNMSYTKRFIDLSIWGKGKPILPSLALSLLMATGSYSTTLTGLNHALQVFFGGVISLTLYFIIAKFFIMGAIEYIFKFAKNKKE